MSSPQPLRLFARRTSSNSQKVLWFLGELGVPYELVATGGDAGGLDDAEYRAMNPNGRVPTLLDGSFAVWESHAILRYLAATRSPDRFWESDPADRSRVERWMDWSQAQFDASFMQLFWGHWRTPAARRNRALNDMLVERCAGFLEVLDEALSGSDFVAGPQLSLADVPVGALMYRYANLDVTRDLPRHVGRWYRRLTERPAYREWVMLPFDELKGRLAP